MILKKKPSEFKELKDNREIRWEKEFQKTLESHSTETAETIKLTEVKKNDRKS
jgi:hypothetical protein